MVCVHGGDYRDFRRKLVEGPVEFVGFDYHGRGVACEQVAVVVLGYTAEKCRASLSAFSKDVGEKCAGCGLAVCAGYREASHAWLFSDFPEHLCAFEHLVAVLTGIGQFS